MITSQLLGGECVDSSGLCLGVGIQQLVPERFYQLHYLNTYFNWFALVMLMIYS
ncbi:hypothetical protein H4J57_10945 [Colwellia sp. BRX8-7]|jgi:hypothetical protein|uniref:hypothetical protein n=1 Tax=Colwellia sp. BRX8-7 TaxID=2759833 RepID=UPI0015F4970E|nr:hypothetical protein [Colwellia sp. BRX8-7]MBA6337718.1 hypothetical protein [Colwellia sp. BRX8-7]